MIQRPKPISGVYTIRNRVTGAVYVGHSANIEQRVKAHFQLLRLGKHKLAAFQGDWDAHGADSFAVGIVAIIPIDDPGDARYIRESVEQDWMRVLDRRGVPLYNTALERRSSTSRRATAVAFWRSLESQEAAA